MNTLGMASMADIDVIVRAHQAGVWRYLRLLGAEHALADDLTQETFVIVLSKPFEHHSDAATASYLRATARFLFLKAVTRRTARATVPLDVAEMVWQEESGLDGGEGLVSALRACIETLDERGRALIHLRYFKRASRREISRELAVSVMGVKSALRRMKAQLRACVERRRSRE